MHDPLDRPLALEPRDTKDGMEKVLANILVWVILEGKSGWTEGGSALQTIIYRQGWREPLQPPPCPRNGNLI